jgi:peptidoglycan/xylan/chitin deacetylase (PgdA/CDA1 family)
MVKYIIRVDDIHKGMDYKKFSQLKKIFLKYKIPVVLAITPNWKLRKFRNRKHKIYDGTNKKLKEAIRPLIERGSEVALHGYTHEMFYHENMLNFRHFGEFAGLYLSDQEDKISKGKKILEKFNYEINSFVAPAHSFDKNTLHALKKNKIFIISDGAGLYPKRKDKILFIPQLLWHPKEKLFGVHTILLHPKGITIDEINKLNKFVKKNQKKIFTFQQISKQYNKEKKLNKLFMSIVNELVQIIYLYKKVKRFIFLKLKIGDGVDYDYKNNKEIYSLKKKKI